ncbi:MAG: hypothetical protein ABJP48_11030 [Erythrobacter sp.]
MKRVLLLVVFVALAAGGIWLYSGGLDRVTEARVEAALTDAGVPAQMAACMAPKMVEGLSLAQLRKLERLKAQEGEGSLILSPANALERLRRVDDPEALAVTTRASVSCAIESTLF